DNLEIAIQINKNDKINININ
ncbi:transformation system protein, partial [Campylobacter jejuni]|nr:transformation system protein [Campylobacter jejuni]EAJ5829163.1 transformation system protein [Campylobacter jejuni]EKB7883182.1 transformation system protein [Campylobacter jejuni]MGW58363.1 transformation system protein [Campylobacter jejuni]